ncbi:MAG: hypothetical protein U5L00_06335 [Desulfovermiculus sp.]|nr:hypothetical protein [Desulfovermiculus sp.]
MLEAFDLPGTKAMTFPAIRSKQTRMGIKMASGTGKLWVEQGMVHSRNWTFSTLMFCMAPQAVFASDVKPNTRSHSLNLAEKVTLLTRRAIHPLPGVMTGGAGRELGMGRTQISRFCCFFPEEKKNPGSNCCDQNQKGNQLVDHNQRSP